MKAKQTRSVKTLKGQLFGAVAMIVVASVALGTSTYAWFINNAVVEVENMQLTVSTSTSMTVAVGRKDGADYTGYKTVIANQDISGVDAAPGADVADWTNMFNYPMSPATTTDGTISTPLFFHSLDKVENNLLTTFEQLAVGDQGSDEADKASVGEGYVKALPLRFLSSSTIDVYFGKQDVADIVDFISGVTDVPAGAAQADAIRSALRVSVVSADRDAVYTDGKAVTFQFDDGTATVVGGVNNTDYNSQNTGVINEGQGLYRGIASISTTEDGTKGKVLTTGQLTAILPEKANADYLATVADATTVTAPAGTATPLFTLQAGEPRDVKVYIWLEGTDQDCVSALSGYKFNLNLPFAGAPASAPAP